MKNYILSIIIYFKPLFVLILFIAPYLPGHTQPTSILNRDTLTLSNSDIAIQYLWNNGELISIGLTDKKSGNELLIPSEKHAFDFNQKPIKSSYRTREVKPDNIQKAHLEVEVLLVYENFKHKRIFRIYNGVPAIASDHYLWFDNDLDSNTFLKASFQPIELECLTLADKHPVLKAIEFFDQTDRHNNLVKTENVIPFKSPVEMKGNILQVNFPGNPDKGIFLLKEAPCSFVQLNYPGHDFKVRRNVITAVGTGLPSDKLITEQWINVYGMVTGCFDGTDLGFMTALRSYQKDLKQIIPERDDMIMMNTWGDRNRDASINEQFLQEEIDACEKLGITHFQIDDGWQEGLSKNSANAVGQKWQAWTKEDWEPNNERLPNGFAPIVKYAAQKKVQLGLWFNPSSYNSFEYWERDAQIILNLYEKYNIRYFKIDGIELPDKLADHRLKSLFEKVRTESNGEIFLNTDATAGHRTGYHYLNTYGNIFLENRYTDRQNYYPHWTLRNLWQLSAYVPAEKLQIEFLNKWRNAHLYGDDPLAPSVIPFEYQFAITMMAQPLAWFEGSKLPKEAMEVAHIIKKYKEVQSDLHSGKIFPIGYEPNGYSWTGFQSILDNYSGYLLVFREKNPNVEKFLPTLLPTDVEVQLTKVVGQGNSYKTSTNNKNEIRFNLPNEFSYVLYRYDILEN